MLLLRGFERQCNIKIIMSSNLVVDVKKSELLCDHDPQKKDANIKGVTVSHNGLLYVLDLTVWRKGFGLIRKADVKKVITTSSITSTTLTTSTTTSTSMEF